MLVQRPYSVGYISYPEFELRPIFSWLIPQSLKTKAFSQCLTGMTYGAETWKSNIIKIIIIKYIKLNNVIRPKTEVFDIVHILNVRLCPS